MKKIIILTVLGIILIGFLFLWVMPYFSKPKGESWQPKDAGIKQYQREDGMWVAEFEVTLTGECQHLVYDFIKREWKCEDK